MNSFGQIQQHCTKVELAKGKYWQYRTHPYTAQCTPHTHTLHQGFPGDAQKRENVWTIFRPGGKALNVEGVFFKKWIWWLYVDITSAHLVWDVLKKSTKHFLDCVLVLPAQMWSSLWTSSLRCFEEVHHLQQLMVSPQNSCSQMQNHLFVISPFVCLLVYKLIIKL